MVSRGCAGVVQGWCRGGAGVVQGWCRGGAGVVQGWYSGVAGVMGSLPHCKDHSGTLGNKFRIGLVTVFCRNVVPPKKMSAALAALCLVSGQGGVNPG